MFPRSAFLALTAIAACAPTAPAVAPAPPERSPVERVLTQSGIESIVSGRGRAFTRQVALMAADLTDEELERLVPAVGAAFEPELLRSEVASFLERASNAGELHELLVWVEGGAAAELERVRGSHEPVLTLEEYARSLMTDPPSERRVRLVAEWADVQEAATFYVLIDEALREAAHAVLAVLRPEMPAFEPLQGDELRARLDNSFNAAVVSFLRSLEPVPDSLLRAATAEYATEAGQWYVETYSLALAEAIRSAGVRVAAALRAS